MANKKFASKLQNSLISLVRVHLLYVLVFVGAIIVFDAWNVITPDVVIERWAIAGMMAVATAIVWYASRQKSSPLYYQLLTILLIVVDLYVATYSVGAQRGIASKSVLLYVIPIMVAGVLLSRAAVYATATIAAALYSFTAVSYFYENPGQAYKAELYGEVVFYVALLYVVASLVWVIVSHANVNDR